MNRFIFRGPFALVLAILAVPVLSAPAQTGKRPHVSRGAAQFVNANDFVGEGNATHLGHYKEIGSAQFSPTADPTVLRVDGWAKYTAANGDQLSARISGNLNGVTGVIIATVTYVGGTGRFSDASGTATLLARVLPGGSIDVAVKGTIDY